MFKLQQCKYHASVILDHTFQSVVCNFCSVEPGVFVIHNQRTIEVK